VTREQAAERLRLALSESEGERASPSEETAAKRVAFMAKHIENDIGIDLGGPPERARLWRRIVCIALQHAEAE
jgi:hypothetical protein